MNVGIDFGSTYSTFATYDAQRDELVPLTLGEGSPASIPSVVTVSKIGKQLYGTAAKEVVGKKNQTAYEAFKMLLVEENPKVVQARGYKDRTPQEISRFFLQSAVDTITERYNSEIENVVICVPEIWGNKAGKSLDGRGLLREILTVDSEGNALERNVRVVTEPEAASAFFAYDYEKRTGRRFTGHLLLIDYGGGTLDLTLTKVNSDGKGAMEISYRASGGVGENHMDASGKNTIGNAGIAYMQDVVTEAMKAQGYITDDEPLDYTDPEYLKAVKELESTLIHSSGDIQKKFEKLGSYRDAERILRKEKMVFTELDYQDGLEITYQQIFQSYRNVIEKTLREECDRINVEVKRNIQRSPTTPAGANEDDFKIALVGGFGNFFLVQHQIAEIYQLNEDIDSDLRVRDIDGSKRETAISLGAALIAAKRVDLKQVARFSVGVVAKRPDNTKVPYYGIQCHQDLDSETIYYVRSEATNTKGIFANIRGNIEALLLNFTGETGKGIPMRMRDSMIEKLTKGLQTYGLWAIGFSMDNSGIITFHAEDIDTGKTLSVPLASYSNLFEVSVLEENEFV